MKRQITKKRKKRCAWRKPWLQRREKFGVYDTLIQELRSEDELEYKMVSANESSMSPEAFDELLNLTNF